MFPQTSIQVLRGGQIVEVLTFAKPQILIGRRREFKDPSGVSTNDVVLDAPRVSSRHAKLLVDGDGITVVDSSANGTFVGSERVQVPRRLAPGELVEIDDFSLRCELATSGASPQVPVLGPTTAPAPESPRPPSHPPTPTHPSASRIPSRRPEPSLDLGLTPPDDPLPQFILDLPTPPGPQTSPVPQVPAPTPSRSTIPSFLPPLPAPTPPATNPPAPPNPQPGDLLAQSYRQLAAHFSAPPWGAPPPLVLSALPQATEAARSALVGRPTPPGPWPEHLARELCGLGPLAPLLDDPAVTQIVVRGADGIDVARGAHLEVSTSRFSCVEALFAVLGRWTGERLVTTLHAAPTPDLDVRAWTGVAAGPLAVITRVRSAAKPALHELVLDQVLPQAAADLLTSALQSDRNLLLHGPPGVDLGALLSALAAELSPARSVCVLRRATSWPRGHALVLAGDAPAAWPCAEALASDWLVVDELGPADALPFVRAARRRGGGALASTRASSIDAALDRLAAALATASGGELPPARLLAASCFDGLVGLRRTASGRLRVDSLHEVRPRGELAELFAWDPDTASAQPTLLEAQVLR